MSILISILMFGSQAFAQYSGNGAPVMTGGAAALPQLQAPPPTVVTPGSGTLRIDDTTTTTFKPNFDQDEDDDSSSKNSPDLSSLLGGMGGGAGAGNGAGGARGQRAAQPQSYGGRVGQNYDQNGAPSGSVGINTELKPCGTLPAAVQTDLQTLKDFRAKCPAANKGDQQKFAINEYRQSAGVNTMYLFDAAGNCKYQTSVAYGKGRGQQSAPTPQACSDNESRFTPPGFHLTVPHPKSNNGFDTSNSMGLAGLEGQLSNSKRGILIHGGHYAGRGGSWGCSVVDQNCLPDVMKFLGYGALVFNSFDDDQLAPTCRSKAGMKHTDQCQPEATTPLAPASPSSDGARGPRGGTSGATGASS